MGNLGAAVVAAVVTVALVVPALFGARGLAAAIGVLQVLLVYAWVMGTAMPGRIGALLIGVGAAAGFDYVVYRHPVDGVGPIVDVFAVVFVAVIVHQLSRGVVRVRVAESIAHVCLVSAALAAFTGLIALRGSTHGETLLSVSVTAIGLAMVAGHLVDAVAPVPRFDRDVEHGLLAVVVSTAVGAGVGYLRVSQSDLTIEPTSGALLGGALGLVSALVGVAVAYICEASNPRRAPFGGFTLPYLRAAVPFALTAPVAFLLGTAVGS